MIRPIASLLVAGCLSGCGSSTPQAPANDGARSQLQTLLGHYVQYAAANHEQAPPDEATFRKFLAGKQVAEVDKLLTSPRDGKALVVTYKKSLVADPSKGNLPPEQREKVIVIREQEGANGKRLVGYSSGFVEEVDASVPLN
ncbi:MAG: hypothetical protein C0467_26685 [Planctomycetaceae bacterium]|nr:hypothetical protein [Planctomycetaceae bacterium]